MKCVILHDADQTGGRNGRIADTLNAGIASLDAHDITYDRFMVDELSAAEIADLHNNYAFVFLPYSSAGFANFYNDATMQLPVIGLDSDTQTTGFGSNGGVSGTKDDVVDRFITADWATNAYTAVRGYSGHTLTVDGTAICTVAAIDTISGAPQTDAGNVMMWSGDLAGGKRMYQSALTGNICPVFAILLQTAIDDGQITNDGTLKKAPMVCDLDHINGSTSHADPTTIDYIASQIGGGMMWCGQQNDNTTNFENMTQAVIDKLKQYSGNKFKYCYHSHRSSGAEQKTTGSWPVVPHGGTLASQITQAQELAIYDSDETIWNDHGLVYHYPAHYNAGANRWDNETIETFAAKGFVSFRMGTGRQCEHVGADKQAMYYNQYKTRREIMGISLFLFHDMDAVFDTISASRNNYRNILQSLSYGMGLYLHDDDFDQTNQEPEAGKVGSTVCEMILDLGNYCSDLAIPFADITEHV